MRAAVRAKRLLEWDQTVRGHAGGLRLVAARATNLVGEVAGRHGFAPALARQWGALATCCGMASALLQGEERVRAALRSADGEDMVVAEAIALGELRGLASSSGGGGVVTDGTLTVEKVLYGRTVPYASTVAVAGPDAAEAWAEYAAASEQLPSLVRVEAPLPFVGGVLAQVIAGEAAEEGRATLARMRAQPPRLAPDVPLQEALEESLGVALADAEQRPLDFVCRCAQASPPPPEGAVCMYCLSAY